MKLIITPDGTLIIPSPVKSDSGLYECMVTNDVGVAMSSHAIELVINKGTPQNSLVFSVYISQLLLLAYICTGDFYW